MRHIKLFESFLSEARTGTGYNSWKMYGNISDLADTLTKKKDFDKTIGVQLAGFLPPGFPSFRVIRPFRLKNVVDFNKFMEVFDLIGESPKKVLDLSVPGDLDVFRTLKNAPAGFYVLRNSQGLSKKDSKIIQEQQDAIFILPEEIPLSPGELKDAIDYAKAGSVVYIQEDPDFFILT